MHSCSCDLFELVLMALRHKGPRIRSLLGITNQTLALATRTHSCAQEIPSYTLVRRIHLMCKSYTFVCPSAPHALWCQSCITQFEREAWPQACLVLLMHLCAHHALWCTSCIEHVWWTGMNHMPPRCPSCTIVANHTPLKEFPANTFQIK